MYMYVFMPTPFTYQEIWTTGRRGMNGAYDSVVHRDITYNLEVTD